MNGKVKVLLVVASLFCITSPALASASCQTKNDLKVCFYEKYTGISHHAWNISVEDLNGPPPDSINISTLIDSTNFPASKIHNAKLYSYENVTYTVPVFDHYDYVNGTLHDDGIVEDYNATHLNYTTGSNQTFVRKHHSPGAYDWSTTDNWWTENESRTVYRDEQRWEWRWERAKEQYFKRNAERFTQGMGTFTIPPNSKWFRYEFDTPVQFWSKGRFALNIDGVQFDPWWNSSWKYKKDVTFTEESGNNLTNYPVEYWLKHEGNAQADCDDVRVISPSGTEIEFNSTSCNSTHVKLAHKINVSSSSSAKYSVYYGNPDATISSKEHHSDRYDDWKDSFEDGDYTYYPNWTANDNPPDERYGINSTVAKTGDNSFYIHSDGDSDAITGSFQHIDDNFTKTMEDGDFVEMWAMGTQVSADRYLYIRVLGPNNFTRVKFDTGTAYVKTDQTDTDTSICSVSDNTWYKVKFTFFPSNSTITTEIFNTTDRLGKVNKGANVTDYNHVSLALADMGSTAYDYWDDVSWGLKADPEPSISVGPEHTSPRIQRVIAPDVHQGDEFLVIAEGQSISLSPNGTDKWSIELPSGFSLPNNDPDHWNPRIEKNETWMTSWRVKAPQAVGTYQINVSGPLNEKSQTIHVSWRAGLTSISIGGLEEPKWPGDTIRPRVTLTNSSSHWVNASSYINLTIYDPSGTAVLEDDSMSCGTVSPVTGACMYYDEYTLSTDAPEGDWAVLVEADPNGVDTAKTSGFSVKKLALSENISSAESGVKKNVTGEHGITKSIIKENLTKELQNRWQNLNASYLNGTAIERVRKLADYLNQTRWGSYIASDLYEISKKGKNISKYINETRWLDKTASDLYNMAKEANSTAEASRKIADYINKSRWINKNATELYEMAKEANSTAELARSMGSYINSSRWIDVNASELKSISVRARNLADYINGTRWGKYAAVDLRNMSDKARKIAEYINETRWKGFVAKDIFSEAESARKEAERTYEEMHDLKRVLLKEMRKTVLRALGIKGPPSSHSSSSSSSSPGGSSVPSSSPKRLPTGKATESKGRGIIGGVVHFFARGVKGLGLIAQSVTGG